jgi:CheY-like chemotaxis protein
MNSEIKILLLEDSDFEAKEFAQKLKHSGVSIKRVCTASEALYELDTGSYDMAVIDPVLSSTLDFGRLLKELSLKNVEIKIMHPGKFVPEYIMREAASQQTEVFSLSDNAKLLSIIEELIKRKTSGGSIVKSDINFESRIVKIELQVTELQKCSDRLTNMFDDLREVIQQSGYCDVEQKNELAALRNQIIENSQKLEKLAKIEDPRIALEAEKTKRFLGWVGSMAAIITAIGALAIPVSNAITDLIEEIREPVENPNKKKKP